ncbi:probable pancreatic secretory proteinase inhibitor isoform X1 [Syngnathoides biaculeatus]|uniref:probable pancreatic secretory proteinase inhibitor isoform X1 n=1 Tax=Syngnathoides biaculeatus TaxID=300417 RepID=UPI002ADD8130|nr:probable pancreatic secretory proteinase inhibitor isoform X1 [Syngnathoides biaculeatus]
MHTQNHKKKKKHRQPYRKVLSQVTSGLNYPSMGGGKNAKNVGSPREPSCPGTDGFLACPLNFAPVCGSDGNTYPNECTLCVHRQTIKMDVLIAHDEAC